MKKAKETNKSSSSGKNPIKVNSDVKNDEKIKGEAVPKKKVEVPNKRAGSKPKGTPHAANQTDVQELIDISDEKVSKPRSDETKNQISTSLKKKFSTKKGRQAKKKSIEKRVQTVQKENEKLREETTEKLCKGPADGGKGCGKMRPITDFWPRREGSLARQTYCHECESTIRTAVTYTCPHCSTTFNRKDNMNTHVAKKHSKIVVLDL